jgi:protoporphyrinogen oxidase
LKAKLSRTDPSKIATAADYFRAAYGRALADEVALPLLQEWSGAPADELSPAVGMGTPDNILETLYLTMARRLTRKPIAIHYCRELPDSRRVWHVYPDGGIGRLCEHLAEDLNDAIHLESPVEHIQVENNRVVSVRAAGRDYPASAAVSTAPYFVLAKLVRGTDALAHLTKFRYRPMVFVNLRMRGRDLLPQIIVWTPEDRFPFFRVAEGPLAAPWLAPEGKTVLTADIGCQVGDDVWTMPDDKLGEWCIDHLSPIVPNARERYLGCRVLRTPFAYPVFLNEYEAERQQLERSLGVGGLYSVGRNGEFAHILMEDVYWRTIRKMERLRAELIA